MARGKKCDLAAKTQQPRLSSLFAARIDRAFDVEDEVKSAGFKTKKNVIYVHAGSRLGLRLRAPNKHVIAGFGRVPPSANSGRLPFAIGPEGGGTQKGSDHAVR